MPLGFLFTLADQLLIHDNELSLCGQLDAGRGVRKQSCQNCSRSDRTRDSGQKNWKASACQIQSNSSALIMTGGVMATSSPLIYGILLYEVS